MQEVCGVLGTRVAALTGCASRRPRPGVLGEPTRGIAGQPGGWRETVDTHVRSGMRMLVARTRVEAAAIVQEVLG